MAVCHKHASNETAPDSKRTSRSQEQRAAVRSGRSNERSNKGDDPPASDTGRSKSTVPAGTKTSARFGGPAETPRGVGRRRDSARTISDRTSRSLSARSSEYMDGTPRGTARTTTTTSAMSTARAEATLAVLEAERAQLERRLKKVEEELEQEELLSSKKDGRKHPHNRRAPKRAA